MKSTGSKCREAAFVCFLVLQHASVVSPFASPSAHLRSVRPSNANNIHSVKVLKEPETLIQEEAVGTLTETETILTTNQQDSSPLVVEIEYARHTSPSAISTQPTLDEPFSSKKPPDLSTLLFGDDDNAEYRRGLVTIGFITLLFSSNSPAIHAAFTETTAPPVLLLNAAVSVVALVGLLFGGPILEATTPLPSSLVRNRQQMEQKVDTDSNVNNDIDNDRSFDLSQETRAGLELGLWKFLGTTANLYGLSLTTASHGAFLIQLTTLIVPVVQGIIGVPIPRRVQVSVGLALAGVFMFTQDASVDISSMPNVALGDALCVVAAAFYATYDLRLFKFGKLVKPLDLITNKIATQAVFSTILLLIAGRQEMLQFFSSNNLFSSNNMILALVVLWSGVAVNAIAPFLQVGGQQAIGPTRAQTLYASQPLWAAIISFVCLGESVGMQGFFGGSAFLAALFLAATAEAPDPDCGKENCEV